MTTQANIPQKWYVPFAQGDGARVEIPVTTADPTRASQTLGFPPLTMQPPESGGVPPQGEDFNGGMNQVARVAWWVLNGGGWPYDATFATQANIQGYPNGATLQSADFRGDWINTADNNQNNPDTTGTGWVPGFQYGVTALAGLTGGTVTPTPAQAAKNSITLAGTLGSALTIVLPAWLKNWTITNNTTGAFVTIVKTAAGSGVTIPQNGAPTRVSGDGTNITQVGENIAVATTPTQSAQYGQLVSVAGNVRNFQITVTAASASLTATADQIVVQTALNGLSYLLSTFSQTINLATTGAGGMDTGAAPASGYVGIYAIYNPTTNTRALLGVNATASVLPTIYGGANLPAGFTASALVAVLPTNGSSQVIPVLVQDRTVSFSRINAFATNTPQASLTSASIATAVPRNARVAIGTIQAGSATAGANGGSIAGGSQGYGNIEISLTGQVISGYYRVAMAAVQTVYYTLFAVTGQGLTIYVAAYEI